MRSLLERPYYTVPANTTLLSYREVTELAGRRLPYTTAEYKQAPTGLYRPDYTEYMLVTGGEGRRRVRGPNGVVHLEHALTPGQLYFFRPMDVHELDVVSRAGLSVICVTFPVETWERFVMASELDQRPFSQPDPPMVEIDLEDPEKMQPFRRILEIWQRRLDTMDLIRFLAETASWFVEAARTEDTTGAPRWLRTAVAAMHEEDNLRAGVARLAELCHVSHTHLWRNTRACYGLSPSDLVNEIRLHHASLLLSSTDTPIAMIAERCGYSSAAHFSTAFRRSRLMSPRDYRTRSRAR